MAQQRATRLRLMVDGHGSNFESGEAVFGDSFSGWRKLT